MSLYDDVHTLCQFKVKYVVKYVLCKSTKEAVEMQ